MGAAQPLATGPRCQQGRGSEPLVGNARTPTPAWAGAWGCHRSVLRLANGWSSGVRDPAPQLHFTHGLGRTGGCCGDMAAEPGQRQKHRPRLGTSRGPGAEGISGR